MEKGMFPQRRRQCLFSIWRSTKGDGPVGFLCLRVYVRIGFLLKGICYVETQSAEGPAGSGDPSHLPFKYWNYKFILFLTNLEHNCSLWIHIFVDNDEKDEEMARLTGLSRREHTCFQCFLRSLAGDPNAYRSWGILPQFFKTLLSLRVLGNPVAVYRVAVLWECCWCRAWFGLCLIEH